MIYHIAKYLVPYMREPISTALTGTIAYIKAALVVAVTIIAAEYTQICGREYEVGV